MILVLLGVGLRAWAIWHLRRAGLSWEQFYRVSYPRGGLARTGPYRYMNHPCYVGSLVWLAGAGMLCLGWGGAIIALPAWPLFAERILREDRLLGRRRI